MAKLNNVILSLNALAPDYALAYDNAVSALGKICQFHRFHARAKVLILYFLLLAFTLGYSRVTKHTNSIHFSVVYQAVATWLNCLPISHDLEEAEKVHEQLCSMVERYCNIKFSS